MARDRGNGAQEQLYQMRHAAGLGSTWLAEIAEQNLNALDGILRSVRRAADAFGHQASSIRAHSEVLVEQAMGNAAEFGTKLAHSKHPLEWTEAQSEFLSKQVQVVASGAQSLGESLVNGANSVAESQTRSKVRPPARRHKRKARGG